MARILVLLASILAASSCARQEARGEDPLRGMRVLDESLVAAAGAPGARSSHIPGATAGTAAEGRGALVYVAQGCVACHAPPGAARPAFAPDHGAVGLVGAERLREVIRHPESFHPGTIMPAYALGEREEDDLVAYLLTKRGEAPAAAPEGASRSCASCHAAAPTDPPHRCVYIADRKEELSCARCHDTVPAGERCAFVESHRALCPVCHETAAGGER